MSKRSKATKSAPIQDLQSNERMTAYVLDLQHHSIELSTEINSVNRKVKKLAELAPILDLPGIAPPDNVAFLLVTTLGARLYDGNLFEVLSETLETPNSRAFRKWFYLWMEGIIGSDERDKPLLRVDNRLGTFMLIARNLRVTAPIVDAVQKLKTCAYTTTPVGYDDVGGLLSARGTLWFAVNAFFDTLANDPFLAEHPAPPLDTTN